jgi:hypothetical protein
MAAPAWVGRLFEPASRVGTSLYLVLSYAVALRLMRRRLKPATEPAARANEALAVEGLGLAELVTLPELDPRFEHASPREPGQIVEVAGIVARSVVQHLAEARQAEPAAMATRCQHAKHHGCVAARFIVADELPEGLGVGVFKPGARYEATLRFSNANPRKRSDHKGDGRGMAIKLRLNGAAEAGVREQDFLLTSHPVFFLDGIDDYLKFMAIAHAPTSKLVEMLRFAWFFLFRLRKLLILIRTSQRKIANPLTASYFSMSVYLLGDDTVVRYRVTPAGGTDAQRAAESAPGGVPTGADFLREAMAAQLSPDEPGGGDRVAAAFDFSVQIRGRPRPADAEHASRAWRRSDDRIVRLARIEVPAQSFTADGRLYECENLVFSPWNVLPEHRPIGSINRVRLAVYLASARLRGRLNMHQPETPAPVPVGRTAAS